MAGGVKGGCQFLDFWPGGPDLAIGGPANPLTDSETARWRWVDPFTQLSNSQWWLTVPLAAAWMVGGLAAFFWHHIWSGWTWPRRLLALTGGGLGFTAPLMAIAYLFLVGGLPLD